MCKKNDDANEVCEKLFVKEYAKLMVDNEYTKELEKEYGHELNDSDSDDPNENGEKG